MTPRANAVPMPFPLDRALVGVAGLALVLATHLMAWLSA